MSITIFLGPLTQGALPSKPFLMTGKDVTIDIELKTGPLPGGALEDVDVRWWAEFCSGDPNNAATPWYRENVENAVGNGIVEHPLAERRERDENGDLLNPVGDPHGEADYWRFSHQLQRSHQYCRIQIYWASTLANPGTVRAKIDAVFGMTANSP